MTYDPLKMKHYHYPIINSTQDEIEKLFDINSNYSPVLVSTDHQTKGRGRRENHWQHLGMNLAISFSLSPHKVATLTSIEIMCLILNFFHRNQSIQLKGKWPNDLFDISGKKCGGIILKLINPQVILIGVGLNLFHNSSEFGKIFNAPPNLNQDKLSEDLYAFILKNRISNSLSIIEQFKQKCFHLNKRVQIIDDATKIEGIFSGIGSHGQALINKDNGEVQEVYSGSLFF